MSKSISSTSSIRSFDSIDDLDQFNENCEATPARQSQIRESFIDSIASNPSQFKNTSSPSKSILKTPEKSRFNEIYICADKNQNKAEFGDINSPNSSLFIDKRLRTKEKLEEKIDKSITKLTKFKGERRLDFANSIADKMRSLRAIDPDNIRFSYDNLMQFRSDMARPSRENAKDYSSHDQRVKLNPHIFNKTEIPE